MRKLRILTTKAAKDYKLLDSGEGEKLERFGNIVLSRPDPQALWRKNLEAQEWKKADAEFTRDEKGGDWIIKKSSIHELDNVKVGNSKVNNAENRWSIDFHNLKFWIKPTPFKHVGIFPEQAPNWEWMRRIISSSGGTTSVADTFPPQALNHSAPLRLVSGSVGSLVVLPEILNLFAYTGGATLACAQAGAKVAHVDSSKAAVAWARENAELSGLKDKPIRWIVDDARDFVRRELKRGRKYDGIIMDPPAFGHGPDNEVWKIEENFLPLIESCIELLSDKPLFFLVNGYASGYSAVAYENILATIVKGFGGKIESGELTIEESKSGRLLPCGIYSKWSV